MSTDGTKARETLSRRGRGVTALVAHHRGGSRRRRARCGKHFRVLCVLRAFISCLFFSAFFLFSSRVFQNPKLIFKAFSLGKRQKSTETKRACALDRTEKRERERERESSTRRRREKERFASSLSLISIYRYIRVVFEVLNAPREKIFKNPPQNLPERRYANKRCSDRTKSTRCSKPSR